VSESLSHWQRVLELMRERRRRRTAEPAPPPAIPDRLAIEGDRVLVALDDGTECSMPLPELVALLAPRRLDTCDYVLPDGVKCIYPGRHGQVVVHQTPPKVHCLRWTTSTPATRDLRPTYRTVRVSLPYVVLCIALRTDRDDVYMVTNACECYFTTAPLKSDQDLLAYPALLNCARGRDHTHEPPRSWVCTQHLDGMAFKVGRQRSELLAAAVKDVLHHVFESGFNHDTDRDQMTSWFTETVKAKIHPGLRSVETWEAESAANPLFALEVPWLPSGMSVADAARRILARLDEGQRTPRTARDLAAWVVRNSVPRQPTPRTPLDEEAHAPF
jgi:hypothetical protein